MKNPRDVRCEYSCTNRTRRAACVRKRKMLYMYMLQGTYTDLHVLITGICLFTNHNYPTKVAENTQVLENVCDVVDPNVEDVQYH
jgi:hypothetical protein